MNGKANTRYIDSDGANDHTVIIIKVIVMLVEMMVKRMTVATAMINALIMKDAAIATISLVFITPVMIISETVVVLTMIITIRTR